MMQNEYSGAALSSFVLGLAGKQHIVKRLLADAGLDEIDPKAWYDHALAMSFFRKIEAEIGRGTMLEVGRKMVEVAEYPPEINSLETLLHALGHWYAMHARGPDVGTITCDFEDEHSAVLDW